MNSILDWTECLSDVGKLPKGKPVRFCSFLLASQAVCLRKADGFRTEMPNKADPIQSACYVLRSGTHWWTQPRSCISMFLSPLQQTE